VTLGAGYGLALILLLVLNAGLAVRLVSFRHRFPTLREWKGPEPSRWPSVSVIVPCRNEARGVTRAMTSLLAQDYPDLEIVAVNDRSEDETGKLLDELAKTDPRLCVLHIQNLPDGWLGKNHAMWSGARRARGSWLLFTDGDVVFERDALRQSVAFAEAHSLGHFVALPTFVAHDFLERAFVSTFGIALAAKLDPATLCVPKTHAYVGVGAFGLVQRAAYDAIGGHEALAFEVADDLKLGLLLRRGGVPQGCLDSDGMISVRWQQGLMASLRGLEKNAFSGCEWRPSLAVISVSALLSAVWLPYLPLFVDAVDWLRGLALFAAFVPMLMVAAAARRMSGGSGAEGLLAPVAASALASVIAWSTVLALWRKGIVWRGTFYPLAELRRRCVREFGMSTAKAVGWTPPERPRR
jgi:hypothetical protein